MLLWSPSLARTFVPPPPSRPFFRPNEVVFRVRDGSGRPELVKGPELDGYPGNPSERVGFPGP